MMIALCMQILGGARLAGAVTIGCAFCSAGGEEGCPFNRNKRFSLYGKRDALRAQWMELNDFMKMKEDIRIADYLRLRCDGLRMPMDNRTYLTVAGEAWDGQIASDCVVDCTMKLALIDLHFTDECGIDVSQKVLDSIHNFVKCINISQYHKNAI